MITVEKGRKGEVVGKSGQAALGSRTRLRRIVRLKAVNKQVLISLTG